MHGWLASQASLRATLLAAAVGCRHLPPLSRPLIFSPPLPRPSPSPTPVPPRHPPSPAGEWFEAKAEPGHEVEPLGEQRELVVGNLWKAVGIYAGVGVVSAVAVCMHKVRGNL